MARRFICLDKMEIGTMTRRARKKLLEDNLYEAKRRMILVPLGLISNKTEESRACLEAK